MRLLGIFLSACVVFAAIKAAIAALLMLVILSLLWGFYLHPRETVAFMAYCGMLALISSQPIATLAIVAVAIIFAQVERPGDDPPG